jgi:hypothetical protein
MRLGPPGHRIPPLLRKNIITSVEAEKLFKMYSFLAYRPSLSNPPVRYFDWINISVSLLDPKLYTAQQVYWRCPFLFTVSQSQSLQLEVEPSHRLFYSMRNCVTI